MTRAHLVDPSVTRWYHCITRCVRRALLLAEGTLNRKDWIERRLEELAEIFAISVGGFSILDNHLHVLVRLDPEPAAGWSDEDVVRRWGWLRQGRFLGRDFATTRDRLREVARRLGVKWVSNLGGCRAS